MTDRATAKTALFAAAFAALVVLSGVATVSGSGPSPSSAAASGVDLSCVDGDDDSTVYVTDSGLTVYEDDDGIDYGTFPDGQTVSFQDGVVNLSYDADGSAEARLDSGTGDTTCLGDVKTNGNDLTVDPDGDSPVVISSDGTVDFAYRDPVYDPGDGDADLAYSDSVLTLTPGESSEAGMRVQSGLTVTIESTGLDEGTTVTAEDADSGEELASADVNADGSVTLGLPNQEGDTQVDLVADTSTPTPTPTATPTPSDDDSGSDSTPVPDASASDDEYTTLENTVLDTTVPGVLANDDPGVAEVVGLEERADNGNVRIGTDGDLEYTPDDGFTGTDTFVYKITNGDGDTDTATVTVEVGGATASVDTNADIDDDGDADEVSVEQAAGQEITGSSTLPAGTELTVRVQGSDSGSSVDKSLTTTADSDGAWSVTGDFSDDPAGAAFTVDVRRGGDSLLDGEVDGRILAPADIVVTDLSVPETARLGDTISVSATVANQGGQSGEAAVGYSFDGTERGERDVALDPGESRTLSFDLPVEGIEPGTYSYSAGTDDSAATGEIEILPPEETETMTPTTAPGTEPPPQTTAPGTETDTDTATDTETATATAVPTDDTTAGGPDTETTAAEGPGFGFVVALAAVFASVSLVLWRRRAG